MAIYENIKLDKGLYGTSKGFLAELESIDPSENYKGAPLLRALTHLSVSLNALT